MIISKALGTNKKYSKQFLPIGNNHPRALGLTSFFSINTITNILQPLTPHPWPSLHYCLCLCRFIILMNFTHLSPSNSTPTSYLCLIFKNSKFLKQPCVKSRFQVLWYNSLYFFKYILYILKCTGKFKRIMRMG